MPKNPSGSVPKKARRRPSGQINRLPWPEWLRFRHLPISENLARDLIDQGILVSALIQKPGSRRGVRLIQAESLDRYLRSLAEKQSAKKEGAAAE